MYYYIKGIVKEILLDGIVLDNNDIGYRLLTSHPMDYKVDETCLVYVYQVIREDEHYLIGFLSKEEKEAFLKLIKIKGIGPKTAINALSQIRPSELFKAIELSDTTTLKKLPGIGAKAASQIILDLKGEILALKEHEAPKKLNERLLELKEVLRNFGYKVSEIDRIIPGIDENLPIEAMIKEALNMLRK